MAAIINYSNLFARLRVLVKYFNSLEVRQVSTGASELPLPYIKNQILSPYETQDLTSELQTLEADFATQMGTLGALKLAIISWFEAALKGIAQDLGIYSTVSVDVLSALADAMVHDSQTLKARELIIHASDVAADGTIEPHTNNIGTGKLIYTFVRPGLSPSEIANAEVLQCQCILSTTAKQEIFRLSGEPSHSRESYLGQGSGLGSNLIALGAGVDNGNFEDWTASAADNWTATVGVWDTEIAQDADEYEGVSAVKTVFAEGDWKITTPVPLALFPNTLYVIGLWVKKETSATGTLRFGLSNGDAVDAFVSGCVKSIAVATLTTTYTFQHLAFKTPAAVDSTWTLGISSDTPGTADFLFDLCQFGAMTLFNNLHFAICSGAVGFGIGDKFGFGSDNSGFEVAESINGVIQKFIGRCFDTQLPSTTGAETITDP